MDYLKFYELSEEAFRNEPDPRFYFESRAQADARMRLMRGLHQGRGLCVVVGEPGCGKTTLARYVPQALERERFVSRLLVVPHKSVEAGWLVRRVARAFGVKEPRPEPVYALGQICERLLAAHKQGRHPVLLIDEAQLLQDPDTLEQLRGLLNLQREDRRLLSIVLLGMEPLDEVLRKDPAFAQRMDIRLRVKGLEQDEVPEYLAHRLEQAKGQKDLFTPEAAAAIYTYSMGTPRLVNTLADNALFEGFMARARIVDASTVETAAEQLGFAAPRESTLHAPPTEPPVPAPDLEEVEPETPLVFESGPPTMAPEPDPEPLPEPAPEPRFTVEEESPEPSLSDLPLRRAPAFEIEEDSEVVPLVDLDMVEESPGDSPAEAEREQAAPEAATHAPQAERERAAGSVEPRDGDTLESLFEEIQIEVE